MWERACGRESVGERELTTVASTQFLRFVVCFRLSDVRMAQSHYSVSSLLQCTACTKTGKAINTFGAVVIKLLLAKENKSGYERAVGRDCG